MKEQDNIIQRADGRIEWICEHGVGHTIEVPKQFIEDESWWVHTCDGCCADIECTHVPKEYLGQFKCEDCFKKKGEA
jgi:hypothetical protein